jgi:hypothetical protein
VIKCNGFFDVLDSSIDPHTGFNPFLSVGHEDIEEILTDVDNVIFKIHKIKLYHDEGCPGEYGGWEIAPYTCIDDYKIKKLCKIHNYITKDEKHNINKENVHKRIEKLQNYVDSFSNDKVKYSLCRVWSYDKLALREVSGEGFCTFKCIHEFENDSATIKNISEMKKWITEYFKEKE